MSESRTDTPASVPADIEVVVDFTRQGAERWLAIDDVVMGGVSASGMERARSGALTFAGNVSLEHGGGFASVRSRPRGWGLQDAQGLALRLRGDGKTYKLNARVDDGLDGVTWQAPFETLADEWQIVRIPFEDLRPGRRGRPVQGVGGLDPGRIRTLGLLISDRQAGPFELELHWIGSWPRRPANGSEGAGR